jgi:hypothetical protein
MTPNSALRACERWTSNETDAAIAIHNERRGFLLPVDACVLNVWLCVARHAIHDTEEAGRRLLTGSHYV